MSTNDVRLTIHSPLGETVTLDPLPAGSTLGGKLSWTKKGELTANVTLPSGASADQSVTQMWCLNTGGHHSATVVKGKAHDTITGTQDTSVTSSGTTITGTDVLHDASGKTYAKVDFRAVTDAHGHWSAQTPEVSVPRSATHLTWTATPDNLIVSGIPATLKASSPGHAIATFSPGAEVSLSKQVSDSVFSLSPSTTDLASCVVGTQRSNDDISTAFQQAHHAMIDSLETTGGIGLAIVLAVSAITRAVRTSRRPISEPASNQPAFDTERHEALLARRADLDAPVAVL